MRCAHDTDKQAKYYMGYEKLADTSHGFCAHWVHLCSSNSVQYTCNQEEDVTVLSGFGWTRGTVYCSSAQEHTSELRNLWIHLEFAIYNTNGITCFAVMRYQRYNRAEKGTGEQYW